MSKQQNKQPKQQTKAATQKTTKVELMDGVLKAQPKKEAEKQKLIYSAMAGMQIVRN